MRATYGSLDVHNPSSHEHVAGAAPVCVFGPQRADYYNELIDRLRTLK
jgi:hypothetical protein